MQNWLLANTYRTVLAVLLVFFSILRPVLRPTSISILTKFHATAAEVYLRFPQSLG